MFRNLNPSKLRNLWRLKRGPYIDVGSLVAGPFSSATVLAEVGESDSDPVRSSAAWRLLDVNTACSLPLPYSHAKNVCIFVVFSLRFVIKDHFLSTSIR